MSLWNALFAEHNEPYLCPDCKGMMNVTEWSIDDKEVIFECINNHVWVKKNASLRR